MAHKLALPPHVRVHDVFHVSLLKRYVHDASHIVDWNVVQVEPEGEEIELRSKTVARVKVQWKHFTAEEATWE